MVQHGFSQLGFVALEIEKIEAENAKERQIRKPTKSVPEIVPEQKGDARDKAGETVGVSGHYSSCPSTANTVRNRTLAPLAMSSAEVYSSGAWLMPPTLGTKIIPEGTI